MAGGVGGKWNDADIESLKQRIQSDFALRTFSSQHNSGGFRQGRCANNPGGICRDRGGHARSFGLAEQNRDQR